MLHDDNDLHQYNNNKENIQDHQYNLLNIIKPNPKEGDDTINNSTTLISEQLLQSEITLICDEEENNGYLPPQKQRSDFVSQKGFNFQLVNAA